MELNNMEGQIAMPQFEKPIPGSSLTSSVDNPKPFEQAPEITKQADGINYLFLKLTDEEQYPKVMSSIREGVPLSEIAQLVLFEGFSQGKWNPDMVLLLFEPLIYMLMALSEKVQIEYVLYPNEEKDDEVLDIEQEVEILRKIADIAAKEVGTGSKVTSLPSEIQERLEEFKPSGDTLSLMEKEEKPITDISLMEKQS